MAGTARPLNGNRVSPQGVAWIAVLPCGMGDPDRRLMRLSDPIPGTEIDLWLLTHRDLRHTGRVRAFLDFMSEALTQRRDVMEGRKPRT